MLISKSASAPVICKYSDAATVHPNPRGVRFSGKFQRSREYFEQLSSRHGPVGPNSNPEVTVRKGYAAAQMKAEMVKLPSESIGAPDVLGGLKKIAATFVSMFKRACSAIFGNRETHSNRIPQESLNPNRIQQKLLTKAVQDVRQENAERAKLLLQKLDGKRIAGNSAVSDRHRRLARCHILIEKYAQKIEAGSLPKQKLEWASLEILRQSHKANALSTDLERA
ncbi:MAG: hypothetical protein JWP38_1638 [Herbaspirillum sp.]|nr:hypothetical protein [Herbaspirillum sp.]